MSLELILTIVFGVIAVFFGLLTIRFTRRKKPVWAYVTRKIIGLGSDAPSELQLLFNGKPVSDVFRTVLIFFNRGNQAIRRADVSRILSVRLTGAKILREPIVRISNEEIGFSFKQTIENNNSAIDFDFSYLDYNDGAVFEILHTNYDKINCVGNIIESGEPRYIGEFVPNRPKRFARRILAWIVGIFLIGVVPYLISFAAIYHSSFEKTLTLTFLGIFYLAWVIYLVYISRHLFSHMMFPSWSIIKE